MSSKSNLIYEFELKQEYYMNGFRFETQEKLWYACLRKMCKFSVGQFYWILIIKQGGKNLLSNA